jgi:Ca-activated chloride channel family protein
MPGLFGRGGAGAPSAAPSAGVGGGAAAPRSGAAAVAKAQSEAQMRDADTAPEAPAGSTLRQVGDKTFVLQNGVWVDSAFDAKKTKPEPIKFGSDQYFKLLTDHPEIARYLALGDKVTLVLQGKAYAVQP